MKEMRWIGDALSKYIQPYEKSFMKFNIPHKHRLFTTVEPIHEKNLW